MVETRTHRGADPRLCGRPVAVGGGRSRVELEATAAMAADEHGLVHGGFVFGLADLAAMLAVDEPTVVLAAAEVRFLAPVRVGDRLAAEAEVTSRQGRRRRVAVTVRCGESAVLTGAFDAVVPERHVLAAPAG